MSHGAPPAALPEIPYKPAVGERSPRMDAASKVDGSARYADDYAFQGMLHAKVVYSPHPHAMVRGIDTAAALAVPGVQAVVTAKDVPGENLIPLVIPDLTLLADPKVRYIGDPVAVVAADTLEAAEEGVRAVKVDYEVLPAVFDPREAMKPGAPRIHEKGNVYNQLQVVRGDAAAAFAAADVVVEQEYRTPYQEHAYLETNGMTVVPEADGSWAVYGCMQCPFYVHEAVARILGVSGSRVRVTQTGTGGGFGGKEDVPSIIAGLAAVAAAKARRPVKLVLTRSEDIATMSKRHPAWLRYKCGASKDGRLTAVEAEFVIDGGGYATLSPVVLFRAVAHAVGPYECAHVNVRGWSAATNKVPCGAFRGFGTLQVLFAIESQMDRLAAALGLDPLEFRKKNALRVGSTTCTGQYLEESVGFLETLERAEEVSGWKQKRGQHEVPGRPNKRRGLGLGCILYGVGLGAKGKFLDRTGAYVQVEHDATVRVSVGNAEMGQGLRTVISQMAAEELGLPVGRVFTLDSDTSRVPDSGPTVASRATVMAGNAVRDACIEIRGRLAEVAADLLGADAGKLKFHQGRFHAPNVAGKAGESVAVNRVVAEAASRRVNLSAQGWRLPAITSWNDENGQGTPYEVYSYATNIAEVEVDIETGEVQVLRLTAAHDLGKAINPTLAEGQIEGGSVQGLGFALTEEIHMRDGKILNSRFATYIIPTAMDIPEIVPILVEHPYSRGPYGAKGIGEPPAMGIAPAVTNAIHDATGVWIDEVPATPERVRKALKEHAARAGRPDR